MKKSLSAARVLSLLLTAYCLLPTGGLVWAEETETEALKAEIQVLKERLIQLEGRLKHVEETGAATYEAPAAGIQLPSGLQDVQISGFVDTSFTYNFNEPNTRTSTLRVFDTRAEDFTIQNAELVVMKPVSTESPVGFRTDLDFGNDAEVVGSVTTGLGSTTDELDLQQAYVEYLAPIGNGLDVKFGKFVTMHGAEVIEAKDNWNFSRSYLFGFAIPFTHTGLRASYPWTEWFSTTVGVNNGWDVVDDNNKGKTVEFSTTLTPLENLSFGGTYMFGAEQAADSTDQRHLFDFVAQYQPLEQLTLRVNVDFAREEDAVDEGGGGNASWNGVAAYAKYDINDWWSLAGRFEVFNDQDGVRTGVNAGTGNLAGLAVADLRLIEWTLTNEFKLNKHLLARLEYRHDNADSDVFLHDRGFSDNQDTVALEFIAPF